MNTIIIYVKTPMHFKRESYRKQAFSKFVYLLKVGFRRLRKANQPRWVSMLNFYEGNKLILFVIVVCVEIIVIKFHQ